MRNRVIAVIALVVPALYLLIRPGSQPISAARAPTASTQAETKQELREEIAAQARARERITERLSHLEGRLNAMELQAPAPAPVHEPPAPAAPRNDLSDGDIATWIDGQLRAAPDAAASQQAASQLSAALAMVKRTDLHVQDVSCGERFCRASFYQDDGELPIVRDLYGAPPLTGEGFTIAEPDGRLGVYFARNGERISDFRDEALLASAP